ncbi:MAG TPA: electron transfer flavoprotein subunit alpha/FixB family protein [Pyrinomonadaceae bacterium]|jgi:electron transfer flavoprotein alpha subunit|nr:electron transfer flavoprotein subunit alpha/FixB family protein [Pyrinomonadaceae bacterium]
MPNGIIVFAEHRGGAFNKTSFEAMAAAQQLGASLGQPVSAVVLGTDATLAGEVAAYKLDKVISVENPKLADYTPDGYADAMEKAVRALDPQFIIMPHTYLVRDYAPKLAARFGKDLISDCVRATASDGAVTFSRRIFQGKIDADVVASGEPPVFATFQSGAYRADQAERGAQAVAVESLPVEVGEVRMQPEEPFQEVKQAVDLTKADTIIAIGRGIKGQEHIALAQQLADLLGGEIAASRPICDAGWLPIDRQIGSSGQTVTPKLYIALGISGAIQHLVGMKNASTIVAVNKDPEAPIFDIADYGIVGDLFEVIPVLTEEIKKLKG